MNFLSSAKDRLAALKIFQVLALVLILQASLNSHIQILSIALIILLAINDYFRKDLSEPVKNISYIFSNIIICFICYKFKNDEASFYYTLMLVDLIVVNKKIIKSIFLINFISNIVSIGILYSNNLLYTIGSALSNYAVTLVICFLIRNIIMEKAKKEQLYEELKETNLTLKEYSNKIEELTITNERTRIAQELHDSIGHSNEDEYIFEGLKHGADGYILKDSGSKEIINSIKTALGGSILLNPKVTEKVIKALNSMNNEKPVHNNNEEKEKLLQSLTPRELEVAKHITEGKSNKAISEALFVTEGTIKNYVSKILDKLQLDSRTELVVFLQDVL
jgi:DNA-binding CsgD family transcriptional regulator